MYSILGMDRIKYPKRRVIRLIIDTDKYVNVTTAAKMLNVTARRVSALIKANRFRDTVRVGHTRLIPREEVLNFERLPPGVKKKPMNKELVAEALSEAKGHVSTV